MTKKMTKKNKKAIIMISTCAIFLVATSLTIGVIIVHSSSNSDSQNVKNAKIALKKLTTDQKTVDLTKAANQKLPSEIKPRIKSIKALNDLIKGVILIPNGVTYTPNVVGIDDDKGELVVEIEIKKGDVKDKFRFVVIEFTTKVENDVAKALAKINAETITIAQNEINAAKAILDKLYNLDDIMIKDDTKFAFEVAYKDWEDFFTKIALDAPNEEDQAILNKVIITISTKPKNFSSQGVTFTISKSGEMDVKSYVQVNGFKYFTKIIEEGKTNDAKEILDNLNTTTINDNTQFATDVAYKDLVDFFNKTALSTPNEKDQAILDKVNISVSINWRGSTFQEVRFLISLKIGVSKYYVYKESFVKVTNFKSSAQAQIAINEAKAILRRLLVDVKTNENKLAAKVLYSGWEDFVKKTNLNEPNKAEKIALNKVDIDIIVRTQGKSSQWVTFIIKKAGVRREVIPIFVRGFKKKD